MPVPQSPGDAKLAVNTSPKWGVPVSRLWLVLLAVVMVVWLRDAWVTSTQIQLVPYSEFWRHLKAGDLQSISIGTQYLDGQLKQTLPDGRTRLMAARVATDLAQALSPYDVQYLGVVENTWLRDLLSWTLPALIVLSVWGVIGRRLSATGGMGGLGGILSVGKSRAKLISQTDVSVSFDDVAGVDEAKAELRESVEFLKNPHEYSRLGARMPKGILLVGPPGTGKTLLARAMAGEAHVPFFSITGAEFVEMFVGVGAARVRDLFEQARASAPCIIFIDELDALGRVRGVGALSGGNDEKEQTLNQLLAEMDGFDTRAGVVILGATNRPEVLDPALLRAGRFDRQVLVDRPDRKGRVDVLKVHLKKIIGGAAVDADAVAALTPGFAGADLANLVNEAALLATRRGAVTVTMPDFTAAVERVVAGLERHQRLLGAHERRTVAVHEMGHAIVAMALPGTDPVHKVSIIPRGVGALGYTLQRPTQDHYLTSVSELKNRLAVLLGGRAAEVLLMGEVSTGAADDLVKATDMAQDMVTRYGMSPEVGMVVYERQSQHFLDLPEGLMPKHKLSEYTARRIDVAVRALVEDAFAKATGILAERRALLEKSADSLLQFESLSEDALQPIAEAAQRGR